MVKIVRFKRPKDGDSVTDLWFAWRPVMVRGHEVPDDRTIVWLEHVYRTKQYGYGAYGLERTTTYHLPHA